MWNIDARAHRRRREPSSSRWSDLPRESIRTSKVACSSRGCPEIQNLKGYYARICEFVSLFSIVLGLARNRVDRRICEHPGSCGWEPSLDRELFKRGGMLEHTTGCDRGRRSLE